MKILMFIDGLRRGGKERQLFELLKGISCRKDFECQIAVMNRNVQYKEFYELDIKINFLVRKGKKDPTIFYKFYRICRQFNPDIIHTWDTMTSIYATPIAKLLKIKLLNGSIRVAPQRIKLFSNRWFINLITFPFANKVLSNSVAGLYSYRVNKKKGVCIHNGFDMSRIDNLEKKENVKKKFGITTDKIVGMVANFTDNKDYETYITAAKIILKKMDDISFLAVGSGPNLEKCKKCVESEFEKNIIFTGRQKDVESIINIFDVGILLTNKTVHGEGISNSIMEYMVLGKPVLATDTGGTKELIVSNKTGFLIREKSLDEISEKIECLLKNEMFARKMGKAGKHRIISGFSLDKMVNNYYKLYQAMIGAKI